MRITNGMIINNAINTLNTNLKRMNKMQEQLSTGKKISLPSDDPLIASKALKYRSDNSEINQFISNTDDGLSWTTVTETALSSMGDLVQRAKELAVQASSETLGGPERSSIKEEVSQLYKQLINLGNASYAGRYIFSGYKTDQALLLDSNKNFAYTDTPVVGNGATFRLMHENITAMTDVKADVGGVPTAFTIVPGAPAVGEVQVDSTTGQLTFNAVDIGSGITNATASYNLDRVAGDYNPAAFSYSNTTQTFPMQGEDIKYEVGIKDRIAINIIGNQIFGSTTATSNSGALIKDFADFRDALDSNDTLGIQNALVTMDNFLNKVLEQRANIGAKFNRLELTQNRLKDEQANIEELMSLNEDADLSKLIMEFKNEENVYTASLSVSSKIIQPTLLDYLK